MGLVGKCAKSAATDFLVHFYPALYSVPIGYFGDTGLLTGTALRTGICAEFLCCIRPGLSYGGLHVMRIGQHMSSFLFGMKSSSCFHRTADGLTESLC